MWQTEEGGSLVHYLLVKVSLYVSPNLIDRIGMVKKPASDIDRKPS